MSDYFEKKKTIYTTYCSLKVSSFVPYSFSWLDIYVLQHKCNLCTSSAQPWTGNRKQSHQWTCPIKKTHHPTQKSWTPNCPAPNLLKCSPVFTSPMLAPNLLGIVIYLCSLLYHFLHHFHFIVYAMYGHSLMLYNISIYPICIHSFRISVPVKFIDDRSFHRLYMSVRSISIYIIVLFPFLVTLFLFFSFNFSIFVKVYRTNYGILMYIHTHVYSYSCIFMSSKAKNTLHFFFHFLFWPMKK